jgi:hypothetical protein
MKTIIAGSRELLIPTLSWTSPWTITEVVSGGARGVDRCGELWADFHGIPLRRFPANWTRWGKAAGIYRNADMAEYGDALVAFWDGESSGTLDMIDKMRRMGKPGIIYGTDGETLGKI